MIPPPADRGAITGSLPSHTLTEEAVQRLGARPGTVHLVGAGPGDPTLVTVRAAALLASADVVLHDQLVPAEILAMCAPHAEVVPVGRRCGDVVVSHEEVVRRMIDAARAGRRVVRLKGGDPTVFGRGAEEAAALRSAGVDVRSVPGISSVIAGPAAAGIPVTHRGLARGFLAVTAHTADGSDGTDWDAVARFAGTVVIVMGRRRWHELTARLVAAGRSPDEPAAAIAEASTPRQHVLTATLATIAGEADRHDLGAPAILVLGDVVTLRPGQSSSSSASSSASSSGSMRPPAAARAPAVDTVRS